MIPLIELNGICRTYTSEGGTVHALNNVSLRIEEGEMVAIMGTSGSGKSTLMNIIGCLDRPTKGTYKVGGIDVSVLDSDSLAKLRREHFGFIFQRYHLLPHLSAIGNTEIPAIYAGYDKDARIKRAKNLLTRLGLADRFTHRPNQLSGGQQQRVSIARALMNGGQVILADEPSGALDKASGREVMDILKELHGQGHTIIIVTHEAEIASNAERIIEISDGKIVRDTGQSQEHKSTFTPNKSPIAKTHGRSLANLSQLIEAQKMAVHAMLANRLRSVLTMLGIVIGITSVISIVALGQGAEDSMLKSLREASGNAFNVFRGREFGDENAENIRTMMPADMDSIRELPDIENVKPYVGTTSRLRYQHFDISVNAHGVGVNSSKNFGVPIITGRDFSEDDIRTHAQVAVIDYHVRNKLFETDENPLGKSILLGNLPCIIIGVTGQGTGILSLDQDPRLHVSIPYTTASSHLLGRLYLDGMLIKVREGWSMQGAQDHVQQLLEKRHGKQDFILFNEDSFVQSINQIVQVATLVLSLVAAISLVVGGVGVMNIMLVSVTERTREIGIRMAVGARERDVQHQFLIEAITLCLVSGLIAISLTFLISTAVNYSTNLFRMDVSIISIIVAILVSIMLGGLFGFLPARNAARLDPIEALARD